MFPAGLFLEGMSGQVTPEQGSSSGDQHSRGCFSITVLLPTFHPRVYRIWILPLSSVLQPSSHLGPSSSQTTMQDK